MKQRYFEKQSSTSLQCGLYSVNNLLRVQVYRKEDMVNICSDLSSDFINPHKHIFGGDYDVNVLFIALQKQGLECRWFDKRKVDNLTMEEKKLKGFLVNIEKQRKFYHKMLGISARHWVAICKESDKFFLCDSQKDNIQDFQSGKQAREYIQKQVKNGAQVIEVYK